MALADATVPPQLVLAAAVGRRDTVTAACAAARPIGLYPGIAVTHARALVSDLEVRPADPAWLASLARHAARHWTAAPRLVPLRNAARQA